MNLLNAHISDRDLLVLIFEEIMSLKDIIQCIPEYISLCDVANHHTLSYKQLYRRVVDSGDFEPDTHYKKDGGEIKVAKSILHLLKRKRKPKTMKGNIK